MPADPDAASDEIRGRGRWRPSARMFWLTVIAAVLSATALFQPMARFAVSVYLKRVATRSGLTLSTEVRGNVLSRLHFSNTLIIPRSGPNPVLKTAKIEETVVGYDLVKIFQGQFWNAITRIEVQGADLRLIRIPDHSEPEPAHSSGSRLVNALQAALKVPGISPNHVDLRNLSVEIESGSAVRSISQVSLSLFAGLPGSLSIGSITLSSGEHLGPISGPLTFYERRISLGPLAIAPNLELTNLSLGGATQDGPKSVQLSLRAGEGALLFSISERGQSWRCELNGKHFPTTALLERFGLVAPYAPDCESLEVQLEGTPMDASSWQGTASLQIANRVPNHGQISSDIEATLDAGELRISSARIFSGASSLNVEGKIRTVGKRILPENISGELSLSGSLEAVPGWQSESGNKFRGRAQLLVSARLKDGLIQLSPRIVGSDVEAVILNYSARSKAVCVEGELHLPIAELLERGVRAATAANSKRTNEAPNTLTVTTAETTLAGPRFELNSDAACCRVVLSDETISLSNLLITAGSNQVSGSLEVGIPNNGNRAIGNITTDLEMRCPMIRGETLRIAEHSLTGAIQGTLAARSNDKSLHGGIRLNGGDLRWGRFAIPALRISVGADGKNLELEELYASLGEGQTIHCSGQTEIAQPFAYSLSADLRFPKLELLQPLLAQAGMEGAVSGGIEAAWQGSGTSADFSGKGQWKLHGKDLRWKNLNLQYVDFAGNYALGEMRVHTAQISSRDTRLSSELTWSRDTLHLSKISLQQKGREVLGGEVQLPLTRDSTGTHWVKDGPIEGLLSGSRIELASIFPGLDGQPPVAGSIALSLTFSGTGESPVAQLSANGKAIKTRYYPNMGGCELDLKARHEGQTLRCELSLASPLGSPLRGEASASLSLDDLIAGKINWAEMPMEISAQIERAKLQALPAVLPQLRDAKGTASIDVRMRGSLNTPIFDGALKLDCEVLHFQTDRIPSITDLRAAVRLDGEHLQIERARADLGGGSLVVGGIASFKEPKNPTLNIDIKAHQVLVQRTQQLSLRLDGDLRIEGPWKAATAKGKLYAVKSMVRKDIELIPIGAMQSTGSTYKRPPGKPWFTFPREPFSDWKLDIHIATNPGDPVLIRGNRLRGTAKIDLRLLGTGAAPTLEGNYTSDDVIALLPFARVEVSRGRVWYSANAPFLPQIEFTAESEIRNHRIRMYLHGPPENPQISVSSDPPLAERDALTLLTAGVLPGDFSSESSQAASSRAAALLVQEFSDKVLLKDGASERFSALRRFSLDVGALNSRTGNQETRLTYRLQDNVFVIGEIGANGDFATRLRYIFRFY